MPRSLRRIGPLFLVVLASPTPGQAQIGQVKPGFECCGAEIISKLVAATPPIDVLGIKLAMPLQAAAAAFRSAVPGTQVSIGRSIDYDKLYWSDKPGNAPPKNWVQQLVVNGTQEQIVVGISPPPTPQVVNYIQRTAFFKETQTVANILDGLRSKYGPETLGPNASVPDVMKQQWNAGGVRLTWAWDAQGKKVPANSLLTLPMQCTNAVGQNDQPVINGRGMHDIRNARASSWNACENYVIVTALVQSMDASNTLARGVEIQAFHWPLLWNTNTLMHQTMERIAAEFKVNQTKAAGSASKVIF